MSFEDILKALCSRVEAVTSPASQQNFIVADTRQGKLACDVLIAHGFDVRFYPNGGDAKLYINVPGSVDNTKMSSALAYAQSLKHVLDTIENLSENLNAGIKQYDIGLAGTLGNHKRITIQLMASEPQMTTSSATAPQQSTLASNPKIMATQKSSASSPKKTAAHSLMQTPEITQVSWFARTDKYKQKRRPDGLLGQLTNYFKGHTAPTFYWVVMYLMILLIIYSLFVVSKGYLCPDFANAEKNLNPWYCDY